MDAGSTKGSRAESPSGKRVAFFGGSFDPPHLGHVAVAREARAALQLDEVLFAPVGLQPLKMSPGDLGTHASFQDRVAMTRLAIGDDPSFSVSLADAPNASGRPNYTIDTLTRLRATLGKDAMLFLLLGADAFRLLPRWRRAPEVPFVARLIIVSRPGEDLSNLGKFLPAGLALNPISGAEKAAAPRVYEIQNCAAVKSTVYVLPDLRYDVSATQLREQVHSRDGKLIPELLDPAVLEYIRSHGLYQ
jgi:nicotinate-nucleotide adenylyltransferase